MSAGIKRRGRNATYRCLPHHPARLGSETSAQAAGAACDSSSSMYTQRCARRHARCQPCPPLALMSMQDPAPEWEARGARYLRACRPRSARRWRGTERAWPPRRRRC
jgi:hypothetical protein